MKWFGVSFALLLVACAGELGGGGGATGDDDDGGGGLADAGMAAVDARVGPAADAAGGASDGGVTPTGAWLHVEGNRIRTAGGEVWAGRGANLQDTRGCNACAYAPADPGEVERRIDELVDVWGADFIRLTLESYASADGRIQWAGPLQDPGFLTDIVDIVDHVGTKPGVYVLLSLWIDPSFSDMGWPTPATSQIWAALAERFADDPHVLFGLVNEPQQNYDGSYDASVWQAMNDTVAAIRAVEDQLGTPRHIISVQGTGGWARFLDYYVDHPITAGGGADIAYEVHVYDPASTFDDRFVGPAATVPVIIGEFGPASGYMTLSDCEQLMTSAEALGVPYLAWTFHGRCPPNLLVDNSGGGCGVGMALEPTEWGQLLRDHL